MQEKLHERMVNNAVLHNPSMVEEKEAVEGEEKGEEEKAERGWRKPSGQALTCPAGTKVPSSCC